ncbi:hypothetical protein HYC85_012385 [Camellia sinensis]|uniref:Protein kinase domain-containing protein n=1 Tax=Camellia sinensis TaxID=4442 RepID=A0A7J7HBT1_CAMSI|nr:hypothetical protein HYC85_012385 [Camellia sinensis]
MPPPLRHPLFSLNIFSISLLVSINSLLFSSCSSIDVQSQALLKWKTNLNSLTDVLSSWNSSDQSPCNWFGIQCNPNGDVVKISLKSVDLQGALPSNLQPLKSLNTLIISSTNISGPIPKEFGEYRELGTLDISGNSISGQIPVEICSLRKLQSLSFNTNLLEGAIPSEIGNLSSLVNLMIYDNQLSDEIPKSIGKLSNLEIFRAGGNQNLKGVLPFEIGNCTSLVMLGLAETSISGSLPSSLGTLQRIQTIAIYTAMLSGPIPEEIGNCTELQNLYLYQNSISGPIPRRIGELKNLRSLYLWQNTIVGTIPSELGSCSELVVMDFYRTAIPSELTNCTALTQLELDNNNFSGGIPVSMGKLKSLYFNKLTGQIPESLSECQNLQALDLSYNNLTGSIPYQIFALRNLTKLLLLSNDLSGFLPPDIGNCTNLYRFRVNENQLSGTVPLEIGNLKVLNFLDMSSNRFVGQIPPSISGCGSLEFLDLHSNGLLTFQTTDLQVHCHPNVGSLTELTKFNLGNNQISGRVPAEILSCTKLQFSPGEIPSQFSDLTKLAILDLSHNNLTGNLNTLTSLQNLVSLNISFNDFSGELPNTPFFHNLPMSNLAGNRALYISGGGVVTSADRIGASGHVKSTMMMVMTILASASAVLVLLAIYVLVRARGYTIGPIKGETWELTFYQKMKVCIDDIVHNLTSANVIGTGSSGVVYRVTIPSGETLAGEEDVVSRGVRGIQFGNSDSGFYPAPKYCEAVGLGFKPELEIADGSLSSALHGGGKGGAEWETRYEVVLGVAHALAYLHHDCVPPILHGDVKAMNVLLGPHFEPYLADFGLARLVNGNDGDDCSKPNQSPRPLLAGSYGYMAPEHASMQKITEKSDVYSFGMVLLEVLTGRHPLDPTLPGGAHLVQWVHDHLQSKGDPADILDPKLRGRADPQMHEILQTLGGFVSLRRQSSS